MDSIIVLVVSLSSNVFKRADKIYAGSYIFVSGISQISKQNSGLNLQQWL